ncbi:uncharacterized protein LOC119547675 [Drosophila subpulchrella]|uniref:uncharacterized protein LOC119547675 n=1 Tax=Drosophila subpulchrella TaxID=1486046 RepID=UPI0018A14D33|nr:uncharacterized protein LOC119547675 [Drosophila subpulchrella]
MYLFFYNLFRYRISVMENLKKLTYLPFEVLDLVFSELSLQKKLELAQADEYLGYAFSYHSRENYKSLKDIFELHSSLPTELWEVLLKYCGSTVKELTWNDDLALAIQQYCPNLESVYIFVHPESFDTIQAFLSDRKDSLKLIELTLHRGVPKTILNVVTRMTNLTKFKIVRYIDDNVHLLGNMDCLQELNIEHLADEYEPCVNTYLIGSSGGTYRKVTQANVKLVIENKFDHPIWSYLKHLKITNRKINMTACFVPHCRELSVLM